MIHNRADRYVPVSLADNVDLAFDIGQGLDLRHVRICNEDMAPLHQAPGQPDPVIARALEGLLFTCGPEHIRQPVTVKGAKGKEICYPLHGSFTRFPARDIELSSSAKGHQRLTGRIDMVCPGGGQFTIWREYKISGPGLNIGLSDRIENTGSSAVPVMIMYHLNVAGRYLHPETRLADGATPLTLEHDTGVAIFCRQGEAGIVKLSNLNGPVRALHLSPTGLTSAHFQHWRHKTAAGDMLSLEPVSHPLEDRAGPDGNDTPLALAPGCSYHAGLTIEFDILQMAALLDRGSKDDRSLHQPYRSAPWP